jgi:hypothetical protein
MDPVMVLGEAAEGLRLPDGTADPAAGEVDGAREAAAPVQPAEVGTWTL